MTHKVQMALNIVEEAAKAHGKIDATDDAVTIISVNPESCRNHRQVGEAIHTLIINGHAAGIDVSRPHQGTYKITAKKPAPPAHHGHTPRVNHPLPEKAKRGLEIQRDRRC